jgi:hypothetical protein
MVVHLKVGVYCGFMEIYTDDRIFATNIMGVDCTVDRDKMCVEFPSLGYSKRIIEDTGFSILFEAIKL